MSLLISDTPGFHDVTNMTALISHLSVITHFPTDDPKRVISHDSLDNS